MFHVKHFLSEEGQVAAVKLQQLPSQHAHNTTQNYNRKNQPKDDTVLVAQDLLRGGFLFPGLFTLRGFVGALGDMNGSIRLHRVFFHDLQAIVAEYLGACDFGATFQTIQGRSPLFMHLTLYNKILCP